jgi:6-hydroxynicotinate 3-monooxygenase
MQIAIIGAGLGGLVAGSMLRARGHDVKIYEQAAEVQRLGAGINLGPNLMKVMRHVGVEQKLIDIGLEPAAWTSRDFRTGNTLFRYPFQDASRKAFGATYLLIHRGDFHAVLSTIVPPDVTEFGMRLTELEERGGKVRLVFANRQERQADIVIGADGINSRVREVLLGPEVPKYTGYVAHRAILPREAVPKLNVAAELTKWWSDAAHRDTHIVVYYLDRAKTELYFVTGVPQPSWKDGTSFVPTDMGELRAAFADFHPEVHRLLEATPEAITWPIFERDPLPLWSRGRIVLLGDACHPMKPHMGQGAAMAIEDAAILARVLDRHAGDYAAAFAVYERARKDRTSLVQQHSRDNKWLRHEMDPSWVFAYDALEAELPTP